MPADQAVEALIADYYKLVFHTIYGLTGNWEESQDLTQDTFQHALKGIDAARAATGAQFHAKAWLLRIALNIVRMQRRRLQLFRFIPFSSLQEKRQQAHEENREAVAEALMEQAAPLQPAGYGSTSAGDLSETIAEQDAVRRTIAKLPEQLRVCLLLSIVSGLSTMEIAEMLRLKEDAVRQRLSRARKQFKQLYAYESGEQPVEPAHSVEPSSTRTEQQRTASGSLHYASASDVPRNTLLTPQPRPSAVWRNYV